MRDKPRRTRRHDDGLFAGIDLLCDTELKNAVKQNCRRFLLNFCSMKYCDASERCRQPRFIDDDPVAIIYTSGTSGEAKGVVINAANVGFILERTAARLDLLMNVPWDKNGVSLSTLLFLRIMDCAAQLSVAAKFGHAEFGSQQMSAEMRAAVRIISSMSLRC